MEEAKDLQDIKRLLVLLLRKMGASQQEIGSALGVTQSRISRAFPTKKVDAAKIVAINIQ